MSSDSTQDQAPGGASPGSLSINGTMPGWAARVDGNPFLAFIDSCLRGVGQVCFMNNPITGLAILVAMFVAEGWLGFAGALGLVVSTLTAIAIGMDRGAVRAGLFGFNGVLVGAGLSLFLQPDWSGVVMVWIAVASAFSTVLHAALANVFIGAWKVPPFTLGFNFITLIFLIGALNYANGHVGGLIAPADAQVTAGSVSNTLRSAADAASANNLEGGLNAIFRGIGQLFFANSVASGIIMVAGLAVCSRIAAVFAVIGSAVGMATGLAVGANGVAIYNGLWGFNSFDAALAIGGVFFVLTVRSGVLAIGCAILAALLFGAIGSLFIPYGLPALTLPFCFATLAFVLLKGASTKLEPVAVEDITTPEEHLRHVRAEGGVGRAAVPA
ncbi:MAG TPA: urea transporter [Solirubrobacteraceae bacterium]|nr:urea transporter [Solirubrobacteraceae bacterium]